MKNMKNMQKEKIKLNIKKEHGKIDWLITLVPLTVIIALCILFFIFPERSNNVLGQIRFFFGDTLGIYYLMIGLGIFILSLYIAGSKYGNIVLGEPDEKPKYAFFTWGSMMFTCGLAADILFYSFSEWVICSRSTHSRDGRHSGMGWSISIVSLEFYTMGILSCPGSCIWLYDSCKKKKASKVFRSLPPCFGKTCRWLGWTDY